MGRKRGKMRRVAGREVRSRGIMDGGRRGCSGRGEKEGSGEKGRGFRGAIDPTGSCDLTHFPSFLNAPELQTPPDHYLQRGLK